MAALAAVSMPLSVFVLIWSSRFGGGDQEHDVNISVGLRMGGF